MLKLTLVSAVFAGLSLAGGALAQDASPTGLPAICLAGNGGHGGMMMGGSGAMGTMGAPADDAHQDLMDGMGAMNADMMAGGTASDIDVAFVCSMIPHHRGAIDMAKAELAHGDDAWAKQLATGIIAAQEKEIADMLAWLERQPQ